MIRLECHAAYCGPLQNVSVRLSRLWHLGGRSQKNRNTTSAVLGESLARGVFSRTRHSLGRASLPNLEVAMACSDRDLGPPTSFC